MKASLNINNKIYNVDAAQPLDISLPLRGDWKNPLAWYQDAPEIKPVEDGKWVASVKEGAAMNFNRITFSPHAHGTHTECVGHISEEFHSVNDCLKTFFFTAELVSLVPENYTGDFVFTRKQLEHRLKNKNVEALVIRTLPNTSEKKTRNWSHLNWPYLLEETAQFITQCGIEHLLIDLPSVDKEEDGGQLLAHRAFWNYPKEPRLQSTITELVFVPDTIPDGLYLLNLQIASFHNNATPSKPVLYTLEPA